MQELDVNISSLKVGKHFYDFQLNKAFLDAFNEGMVEDANLQVDLELKKSETMIEAQFSINGEVTLVCDRSWDLFVEPVHVAQRMFFKYAEQADELSEELVLIPYNQASIDFSPFCYEFVALTIPIKKLHPRFREEEGDEDVLVYSSGRNAEFEEEDDAPQAPADPRWEALKKLRNN